MSGSNSTTLAGILKNVYDKSIIDNLNQESWAWDKLPNRSPDKPVGNGFYFPIKFASNQAVGPQNPGEALRSAQSFNVQQATVTPKVYTGTIELELLTKAITEGDNGAFVAAWDALQDDVVKALKKRMNIDFFGRGTGRLTLVNGAVSASTSVTLDTAQPIQINQLLDFYDSTDTTRQAANVSVSNVNLLTRVITLSAAITCDDNAVVYGAGEKDSAPSDGKGMGGLERMVDTTSVSATYFNVSASTYIGHQATVLNASSASISNDLLQRLYNQRQIRAGKDASRDLLLMSHVQQMRKYLDLVTPQKRFSKLVLDSGFTTLEWNGHPFIFEDVDCQEDTVYMLDPNDLHKWIIRDLGFDDTDGSVIKHLDGYDKILAYVKWYGQVGVKARIRHAKVHTLATPTL